MRKLLVQIAHSVRWMFWSVGLFLPKVRKMPFGAVWAQWYNTGSPRFEVYEYKGTDGRFFFFKARKNSKIIWKKRDELGQGGFMPFLIKGGKP